MVPWGEVLCNTYSFNKAEARLWSALLCRCVNISHAHARTCARPPTIAREADRLRLGGRVRPSQASLPSRGRRPAGTHTSERARATLLLPLLRFSQSLRKLSKEPAAENSFAVSAAQNSFAFLPTPWPRSALPWIYLSLPGELSSLY